MSAQRFRRLTDLFVAGRTIELPDGSHLWVQAINAYERDECVSDGQVARARLVLALKDQGTERLKIEAKLVERGREALEAELVEAKVDEKYSDFVTEMEGDPDWTERLAILRRTDWTQAATPGEEAERELVEKIFNDYTGALQGRLDDEREWQQRHYHRVDEDELLDDYLDVWLDRRGAEVASAEYALTETWYATRYCEATDIGGVLDHTRCNGHPDRVFETKSDAKAAPDALQKLINQALNELAMAGRDPKGSASPASSSDSSPTPSAAEGSTPSTSTATPNAPPGT